MISGPVVGRLLETLVFLIQPKLVLELGTYAGTSALMMAGALPEGGRIVTCELSDEHADWAQAGIDALAVRRPHRDPARPATRDDRGHRRADRPLLHRRRQAGYADYYEAVLPKLSPRGLIAADNTLRGGAVLEGDVDGRLQPPRRGRPAHPIARCCLPPVPRRGAR
jgi:caffeoyl-CoA O-methyltransferase